MAFADGRIATAGADGTVRVWDPETGHAVVMRGHTGEVYFVDFADGGKRVVSAGDDGTVRLWDPRGGATLAVLQSGDDDPVYGLAVAKDGTIATYDSKRVVRVFRCGVCGSDADVRARAAALHPRELTHDERERFLGEGG
jgi:WD40 repeat protein